MSTNPFGWIRSKLSYIINGREVPPWRPKAACEAVVAETMARMNVVSELRQRGATSTAEWYTEMVRHSKHNIAAQIALGRGGWDEMRPSDWKRAEAISLELINGSDGKVPIRGLYKFAQEIDAGRYGDKELSKQFLHHAQLQANIGRGVYENERVRAGNEIGHTWAQRLLAAVENCVDCVAWAALGRIPIEEMLNNYPINASVCGKGGACHCVIITGRD